MHWKSAFSKKGSRGQESMVSPCNGWKEVTGPFRKHIVNGIFQLVHKWPGVRSEVPKVTDDIKLIKVVKAKMDCEELQKDSSNWRNGH